MAELSDVHHPFLVIPPEMAGPARLAEQLGLPGLISSEALVLMGQNWRYSSAKAAASCASARARWTRRCATRSPGAAT